jgi:hypothetical protein
MTSLKAPILAIVASALLASCARDTEHLFESPCPAPCWYGIIPGTTTRREFLDLMPSLPYYREEDAHWREVEVSDAGALPASQPYALGTFSMATPGGSAAIYVELVDSVVSLTEISSAWGFFSLNDIGLTLEGAIAFYGEPSEVILGKGCGGDQACYNLFLLYPNVRTIVQAELETYPPDITISPSLQIRRVTFLSDDRYPEYLEANIGYSLQCLRRSFALPWPSYGPRHFDEDLNTCD